MKEWQLDGVAFDFENTTITKDITLKAIWNRVSVLGEICLDIQKTEHPTTPKELRDLVNDTISKNPTASLNYIDVSAIKDMSYLFSNKSSFNGDISCWDVSNVTNMESMFFLTPSFNQPLNSWDVSKVNNMQAMFYGVTAFNQDISKWNVAGVKYDSNIFDNSGMTNDAYKPAKFR